VKPLAIFLLLTPCLCAQHFGYGIKAGVPFTAVFSGSSIGTLAESGRFAIGPMVELRLPLVGIEADLLYHRDSYTLQQSNVAPTRASGSSWQFPIVGKLRLPTTPILKPYGEAGVAFRSFTGSSADLKSQSKKGFVLGAGLDIHAIVIHITPELRFTRWGSTGFTSLQANQNQFEFLVGISR
jgi:opacity protein-like surface antigen